MFNLNFLASESSYLGMPLPLCTIKSEGKAVRERDFLALSVFHGFAHETNY